MKKRSLVLLAAVLATMTFSTTAFGDGFKKSGFWSWWASSRYQTSDLLDFVNGGFAGAVTLVRERNRISGRIMANVPRLPGPEGGTPGGGTANTVWLIVVNEPSECQNALCLFGPNPDDLARPETETTVFNATAAIVNYNADGNGVLNADFEVEAGRLPEGLFILDGSQRALRYGNGFKSLIILVIDQHPPVEAGESWIYDLTTTEPPGGPNNASISLAVLVPCPDSSCPTTVYPF